jgi:ribonucleoside-diphosphate reductase alpha chain
MLTKRESKMSGPANPSCDIVHAEKYRGENETFREAANRQAGFLQDNHDHYMKFRDLLLDQRFLPPGRVQAGAGSLKTVTLFNCFVMPTIHDSFTDGPTDEEKMAIGPYEHHSESIMDVAKMAAITMRQGGGVGYDFSTLRPKGDMIKGVQSFTDGPLAFAKIFDAVCGATASAGNRRGAQMLVMRIDHPDIESFIRAKQVADQSVPYELRPLRGFNMSVAVTDEFMECLENDKPFPLKFGGKVYREIDPRNLWDMIMRGTYDWAEPGVLFIDTINKWNNLWYCETIAATNPCGEQPLPPYGACLLGSMNLVKYLYVRADGSWGFDYNKFIGDIPTIIRAMDNVIDRSRYPLPEQRKEAEAKRRIGIGITGLANALEAMGLPYGSPEFLEEQDKIMNLLKNESYRASAYLAREKGAFPLFDKEKYMQGLFIKTLDEDVQALIAEHGIRNSHLTSIAPTGTISFTADNVSSGIEPVIAYQQKRKIIFPEGVREMFIPDFGVEYLGVKGKTVSDGSITAQEHIAVLCMAQKHVDSACSKTVNVPREFPFDQFKNLYFYAWKNGAKGCTTYRPNDAYDEPIQAVDETPKYDDSSAACGWDPVTGARTGSCAEN